MEHKLWNWTISKAETKIREYRLEPMTLTEKIIIEKYYYRPTCKMLIKNCPLRYRLLK